MKALVTFRPNQNQEAQHVYHFTSSTDQSWTPFAFDRERKIRYSTASLSTEEKYSDAGFTALQKTLNHRDGDYLFLNLFPAYHPLSNDAGLVADLGNDFTVTFQFGGMTLEMMLKSEYDAYFGDIHDIDPLLVSFNNAAVPPSV